MNEINWEKLRENSTSGELKFENFNYQIAFKKYAKFGIFNYFYNTPGSEFYLTLLKDCEELNCKAGDVIGWQAKFWLNSKAPDNSPLDTSHREELINGLKKSLEYKSDIKKWIICTPGKFSNTKSRNGNGPVDLLLEEFKNVDSGVVVDFWYKEMYEAIRLENNVLFDPVFNHYFSENKIDSIFFIEYSKKKIQLLHNKFNSDLYVKGSVDREIFSLCDVEKILDDCSIAISTLHRKLSDDKKLECLNEAFPSYIVEHIDNKKELIRTYIGIAEKLFKINKDQILNIEIIKDALSEFEQDKNKLNDLLEKIGDFWNDEDKILNNPKIVPNASEHNSYKDLLSLINILHVETKKIIKNFKKVSKSSVHVFGGAGYGKSNLACSVAGQFIKENIPAMLILAAELKNDSILIENQILNQLCVENSVKFMDLLGSLDDLGFIKKKKLPIIIDGLNEITPTADVWPQLFEIMEKIKKFDNIILVTTCRESYSGQVFKENEYKKIENQIHLDGFDDKNIEDVINKYFNKYNITAINENFNKELLKHPLMLDIFSKANKDSSVVINESNIYGAVEKFIENIIAKVSTKSGVLDPVLKNQFQKSIDELSLKLWNDGKREIGYLENFIPLFDPAYSGNAADFTKTNSYKIMDEGLFSREMKDTGECIKFTHDLVAGFCIARAVFFNTADKSEIEKNLKNFKNISKLNGKDAELVHTLSEDITKAIIYFSPIHTDKQVYEIIKDSFVILNVINLINLITQNQENLNKFSEFIESLDINDENIKNLLKTILAEILVNDRYENVEILRKTICRMNLEQINLIWAEILRLNSHAIFEYLKREIELLQENPENNKDINARITFVSILLCSTHREMRDFATKYLVEVGVIYFNEFWKVFKSIEKINDIYIIERMIAATCGIILRVDSKEFVLDATSYLCENYIQNLKTTHILILDYLDTIRRHAIRKFGYIETEIVFDLNGIKGWYKDKNCEKKISNNQVAEWGYPPINRDFARYKIGHLDKTYYERGRDKGFDLVLKGAVDFVKKHLNFKYKFDKDNPPKLKDLLPLVIWKMKNIGYNEKIFKEVDRKIDETNRDRFRNSNSVERYAKKYSWISFFELYGHMVLLGLVDLEERSSFRTSDVDIDPTFPKKPKKFQLANDCFLPKYNEKITDWINEDYAKPLLDKYYKYDFVDGKKWVLLNAKNSQSKDDNVYIDIYVDSYLVKKDCSSLFLNDINRDSGDGPFFYRFPEYYYLFAGESSWSENIANVKEEVEINDSRVEFSCPYFWFNWEEHHSILNDVSGVPILAKEIAEYFDMAFDSQNLEFNLGKEKVTKFICDGYSHYLYIREDILQKFLKENELDLIWSESGRKHAKKKNEESGDMENEEESEDSVNMYKEFGIGSKY